jgi:hexosaminidase
MVTFQRPDSEVLDVTFPRFHTLLTLAASTAILAACRAPSSTAPRGVDRTVRHAVIPVPATIDLSPTDSFSVTPRTSVYIGSDASAELQAIGDYAANMISSMYGTPAKRLDAGAAVPDSNVMLAIDASRTDLGDEGYEFNATRTSVRIVAATPAGVFHGVQTFRQLLPASIEQQAALNRKLKMPAAHVVDVPHFAWRGGMLDIARHYMPPSDIKRFIDYYALYKLNRLHLHLADDQGWRIQINSWPKLTEIGSKTAIGGAPGGYWTQQDYADVVAYAKSRYITIVPEIDIPGHTNAALNAYPDLKCDRVAPPVYLRVGGPPNSLCVTRDRVYGFVADVVREIVNASPTGYFHIGGDEVQKMSKDDYHNFLLRTEKIVTDAGARMIAWSEAAPANLSPNTILQSWTRDSSFLHSNRGGKVIVSVGPHAYLDMKYDSSGALGLLWAGAIDLKRAYDWDPATILPNVAESSVLGVEAPLWAETLMKRQDWEYQDFPRILAIAELGWSPKARVNWDDFARRIGAHGARLANLGVNFARVPGINWTW